VAVVRGLLVDRRLMKEVLAIILTGILFYVVLVSIALTIAHFNLIAGLITISIMGFIVLGLLVRIIIGD
jgi:hypothetical protein